MQGISHTGLILVIGLLLCFTDHLKANTDSVSWVSGRIYFQIKADLGTPLPTFYGGKFLKQQEWGQYKDLLPILKQSGATELKPAFKTQSDELDRIYLMEYEAAIPSVDLQIQLEQLQFVEFAESIPIYYTDEAPNDFSNYPLNHLELINSTEAWQYSKGSKSVRIAIIDDGFMLTHEDLEGNIWKNPIERNNKIDDDGNGFIDDIYGFDVGEYDNDPSPSAENLLYSHGTRVAGSAVASTNNDLGISSIGYSCSFIPVKATILNQGLSHVAEGVDYAIKAGADIVSMSFSSVSRSEVLRKLINEGTSQGIIFVASAGNFNTGRNVYPAALSNVIGVGAVDNSKTRAYFSNYGENVDIVAPGLNIQTTFADEDKGNYNKSSGTSFAAPIVAGTIGLMKAINPCLNTDKARFILQQTALSIDSLNPEFEGLLGAGLLQADLALSKSVLRLPEVKLQIDSLKACGGQFKLKLDPWVEVYTCDTKWQTQSAGLILCDTCLQSTLSFEESSNHVITSTISNPLGETSASFKLALEYLRSPYVEAGPDITGCIDDVFALEGEADQEASLFWLPELGIADTASATTDLTLIWNFTYTLYATLENGCINTDSFQTTAFIPPFVEASVLGPDTLLPGDTTSLEAIGPINDPLLEFMWYPQESLSDPSAPNPKAFPITTTRYFVTAYDAESCPATDTVWVYVEGTTAAEARLADFTIHVTPNPVGETWDIRAKLPSHGLVQVSLIDSFGRLLEHRSLHTSSKEFHQVWKRKPEHASGIYFLRLDLNGLSSFRKLFFP